MNRDFDFDDIGKRMPYKTPESFFEDNRRRILKHTCGEERRVKNRLHIIIPTVLAAAALLAGLLFMPLDPGGCEVPTASPTLVLMAETESANSDAMDHFIENLSDEELQELAELSETDIFLF